MSLSWGCPGTAAQWTWQLKPALACRMSESLPGAQDRCTRSSPYIALQVSKSSPAIFWIPKCRSYKLPKYWFTPWFSFAVNQLEKSTRVVDLEIIETKEPSESRSYNGWWIRLQQVHFPVPYKVLQCYSAGYALSCHIPGHAAPHLHPIAYFWQAAAQFSWKLHTGKELGGNK